MLLADQLRQLHEQDRTHGALSPSMVTIAGGATHLLPANEARPGVTPYTAPELLRGEPADARSDSDAVTAATRAEALAGRSAWDERRGREDEAIRRRREKALPTDARGRPVAGLALSGGGIRSATFCLGLIQGLARNGLLRRFDYLSSISGGGYIAAAVGRLIQLVGIDRAMPAMPLA